MKKIDCNKIIDDIRNNKDKELKRNAINQAYNTNDLWEKCVLLRKYTSPQSTDAEKLIKYDLDIGKPINSVSGDGNKRGVNYEIKVSVHDKGCKTNIRQIRPHHNVDFYIIVALNVFGGRSGEAFIFKVPSDKIYEMVVKFGGYTHGTVERNGIISAKSIKDKSKDFEYSLSADPNADNSSKSKKLWNKLLEYSVNYKRELF